MATYSNVFQYDYETLKREGFPLQGRWSTHFKNDYPITLELGCGKGEYTVDCAKIPGKLHWHRHQGRGCGRGYPSIEREDNERDLLKDPRGALESFFSENEVSEIWITFRPQMKKVNKRLTSTRFMKEYSRILKPGGIIHLKTDSNFLYQYTLAMIEENGLELLAETDDLYNSDLLDNALSIQTFYEQQWLERGINIKYIRLLCPKEREEEWREPELEIERDDYRSFGRNARV